MTGSPNVDLVRSIWARWERGDFSPSEWAHPEIEYVIADGPSPGSWRGVAGMAKGWREWLTAFEGVRARAEEYRELDEQRILVLYRVTGRGKVSGLELGEVGSKGAGLFYVRDGQVTKHVAYFDRAHALGDLGLPSEGE